MWGWMDGSVAGRGGGSGRAGQVWRRLKRSTQAAAGQPLTANTPSGAGVRPRQMLQLRAAAHAVGAAAAGEQPHSCACYGHAHMCLSISSRSCSALAPVIMATCSPRL